MGGKNILPLLIVVMELALLPFPFVWDLVDTLPVEMSMMLPELSLILTMMTLTSAMTLVSWFWKIPQPTAWLHLSPFHLDPCLFLRELISSFPDGAPPPKVVHCLPLLDKSQFHMSTMMTALMLMVPETLLEML